MVCHIKIERVAIIFVLNRTYDFYVFFGISLGKWLPENDLLVKNKLEVQFFTCCLREPWKTFLNDLYYTIQGIPYSHMGI